MGRRRHYYPAVGRWTTKDPIGFNGGETNLYSYVYNNPMSYVDPPGTDATTYIDPTTMHSVIRITDPSSKTGFRFFDFGPGTNGIGLAAPVSGLFFTTTSYDGLKETGNYKLNEAQDKQLRDKAMALGELIKSGNYKYTFARAYRSFWRREGKKLF